MAEEDARAVVVAERRDSLGRTLVAELRLLFVPADVTREPDVAELVERTTVRLGRLWHPGSGTRASTHR
jgi:hypothetical protein